MWDYFKQELKLLYGPASQAAANQSHSKITHTKMQVWGGTCHQCTPTFKNIPDVSYTATSMHSPSDKHVPTPQAHGGQYLALSDSIIKIAVVWAKFGRAETRLFGETLPSKNYFVYKPPTESAQILSETCGGVCFQLVANLLKRPCSEKLRWVLIRMVIRRHV